MYTYIHIHTYIYTYIHTYIHACMHSYTYTQNASMFSKFTYLYPCFPSKKPPLLERTPRQRDGNMDL